MDVLDTEYYILYYNKEGVILFLFKLWVVWDVGIQASTSTYL